MYHNKRDSKGRFAKKTTTSDSVATKQPRDANGRFASNKTTTISKVTKKPKKTKITTSVDVLILDASGSMASYTNQTIEGVNQYFDTIAKSEQLGISAMINVVQFGCKPDAGVHWTHKNVLASTLPHLDINTYHPYGGTPLNDAIMEGTKNMVEARKANPNTPITVTIFTDGEENSSKTPKYLVGQRIKELNEAGVTVTFMGAGSDSYVKAVADSYGIDSSNTLAYQDSLAGRTAAMNSLKLARSTKSKAYASGQDVTIGFFTQD